MDLLFHRYFARSAPFYERDFDICSQGHWFEFYRQLFRGKFWILGSKFRVNTRWIEKNIEYPRVCKKPFISCSVPCPRKVGKSRVFYSFVPITDLFLRIPPLNCIFVAPNSPSLTGHFCLFLEITPKNLFCFGKLTRILIWNPILIIFCQFCSIFVLFKYYFF